MYRERRRWSSPVSAIVLDENNILHMDSPDPPPPPSQWVTTIYAWKLYSKSQHRPSHHNHRHLTARHTILYVYWRNNKSSPSSVEYFRKHKTASSKRCGWWCVCLESLSIELANSQSFHWLFGWKPAHQKYSIHLAETLWK